VKDRQVCDFLNAELLTPDLYREELDRSYLADESRLVKKLLAAARLEPAAADRVNQRACSLVKTVRAKKAEQGVLDAFMQEYDLSSEEGVVLMCLAEALLRIPDDETAEKLIADKLGDADWESHLGRSSSILVNASTWGLMLTGKLFAPSENTRKNFMTALGRLINRSGEPMVRTAIRQAMRIMGHQYVMGRNIEEALDRSLQKKNRIYRHSFDMLGEAALTAEDAARYQESYRSAIAAIGARDKPGDIFAAPSISVKLSALHPRFEFSQHQRVLREIVPHVLELAQLAMARQMAMTIDTEEADRLMWLHVPAGEFLFAWSRAPIGTQKSSIRRWKVTRAIRSSPARQIPTSLLLLARGRYLPTGRLSTRSLQPIMRKPLQLLPSWLVTALIMNFSACTAWGRTCTAS